MAFPDHFMGSSRFVAEGFCSPSKAFQGFSETFQLDYDDFKGVSMGSWKFQGLFKGSNVFLKESLKIL